MQLLCYLAAEYMNSHPNFLLPLGTTIMYGKTDYTVLNTVRLCNIRGDEDQSLRVIIYHTPRSEVRMKLTAYYLLKPQPAMRRLDSEDFEFDPVAVVSEPLLEGPGGLDLAVVVANFCKAADKVP